MNSAKLSPKKYRKDFIGIGKYQRYGNPEMPLSDREIRALKAGEKMKDFSAGTYTSELFCMNPYLFYQTMSLTTIESNF